MIEIQNVTVYKCEHCNYTDTMKARLLSHENKCLSEQLKTAKNKDKQEIYNILDLDIINIKIKEFLEKYKLTTVTNIEFIKITIDNLMLPSLKLDKSIRGIFDKNNFKLGYELASLRHSKEYLADSNINYKIDEIENHILLKEKEVQELYDKKSKLILDSVLEYLKVKV